MEEKDLLSILAEYGSVEIVSDNILLFTNNIGKIYLRYSMGGTFSFLKGSAPIKIQTKKGFSVDRDKFKTNLEKVMETEISGGKIVEYLHLGGIYLAEIKNKIHNIKPDYEFEIKGNKLVFDTFYARISICPNNIVEHTFGAEFLKIKDINKAHDIVFNLSSDIQQLKTIIKNN